MKAGQEIYSSQALMGLNRRLGSTMDLKPEITPGARPVGRVEVIAGLESKVSLLQVARGGLSRIQTWLEEIRVFLEEDGGGSQLAAPSIANEYVAERLRQISSIVGSVSFSSKILLNGRSGVRGEADGAGLQFVRGSARTLSSVGRGYPVSIDQLARPSSLIGSQPVIPSVIAQERWIALKEGDREARYKVKGNEEPQGLVENLQQAMDEAGLDIRVFLTRDQRLLFLHNQMGSGSQFEGGSQATKLVSGIAGLSIRAMAGQDIKGNLGTETAHGSGSFLVGNRGNPRTEGLIVYYDGPLQYPGQVVGYVQVNQSGILVPLDVGAQEVEMLSLPDLGLATQAIGVSNHSGFKSLAQIRAGSAQERRDGAKLARRAQSDLGELSEELKWKEDVYVDRAMGLLKSDLVATATETQEQQLNAQKAQQMALDLKSMIGFAG